MASIFDTTANTEFNSFSDPFNPANMNPGQWGINPNYLTPSYSAPFRPSYSGPQGWSNPNQPGFVQSVGQLTTPFGTNPMYGNPYINNMPYMEQVHSRPLDAVMWANQRIVVPATSLYLSYKLGNIMTRRMNHLGGGLAGAASYAFGGSEAEIAAARTTQGIFAAMGDRFSQGTVQGMFGMARRVSKLGVLGDGAGAAAFRASFAEGAGVIGGIAGGLLLPTAIGMAGAHAFSSMIVDPYISFRRTSSDLRRNFQNVNVAGGGSGGGALSGQGMSFGASSAIGRDINSAGIRDFTFSSGEMSQISDYSARSGLLDDATINQISKRVKNIANQVKMVMRIANEPDIKNAIEMLSRLNVGGASVTSGEAGRALSSIGANATIAGISTQRMMNTVGAQGQYLFGANGLVPYMGQIAASSGMATFASANRQGVMSRSLLAMMGGEEGATQSSLTAQVNGSQTTFNRIMMANRYMGGFTGSGVVQNLNAFGANFARNPMGTYGETMMNSGLFASHQFAERGELGLQDQIMQLAGSMHMVKRNGRIDASNAYMLMTGMLGLSHDNAFAYIQQMTAGQNSKVQKQMLSGNDMYTTNQMTQQTEQMGLGYGKLTPYIRSVWGAYKKGVDFLSSPYIGLAEGFGNLLDKGYSKFYGLKYGEEYGGGGSLTGIKNLKQAYQAPDAAVKRAKQGMMTGNIGPMRLFSESMSVAKELLMGPSIDFSSIGVNTSYGAGLQRALTAVGGDNPLEATRKIQAAKVIISKGADLDVDDPETQKLMAIIGANGENAKSMAAGIVDAAGKNRVLFTGALFGTKSSEEVLAEVDKNPNAYLSEGFLQDYKNAPNAKQRQMALILSGIKNTSNTKWDKIPQGPLGGATPDELVALSATQEAGARRSQSLMRLAKEGKIDPSSVTLSMASDKMLEAANIILQAAGVMAGKPVGASADSSSPISNYNGAGIVTPTGGNSMNPFQNQTNRQRR